MSISRIIVSLIDRPIFEVTVPAKIQTYIAAKKPILAVIKGDSADIINQNKLGKIDILKIDVEGLEAAIIKSLSSKSLKKIDRIYAETSYPENLPGFEKEQYGDVVRFRKI